MINKKIICSIGTLIVLFFASISFASPLQLDFSWTVEDSWESPPELSDIFPNGSAVSGSLQIDSIDLLNIIQYGTSGDASGAATSNGFALSVDSMLSFGGPTGFRDVNFRGIGDTFLSDYPAADSVWEFFSVNILFPYNIGTIEELLGLDELTLNAAMANLPPSLHMQFNHSFQNGSMSSYATSSKFNYFSIEAAPVPEPSTVLLLGSGLVGLAWYGRKRKKV